MKPRHIFNIVTLSVFLFAQSALQARAATFLPPGQVQPFQTTPWTFSISTTNVPKPTDWPNMDENQVFFRLLSHTQLKNNWTIKIGKGGQLYSISTPQTGELIPIQRPTNYGAEWIDEVFQHTIPYNLTTEPDGDIHQAGYYAMTDSMVRVTPHSVYSPRFNPLNLEMMNVPNSISFITWPQHAHLPRTYKENLLVMNQNVRDLGDGVIEVTVIYNKWGGITTTPELIQVPWSPVRTTSVPTQILSNPDGTYKQDQRSFYNAPNILRRDNSTGGWMAFTKSNSPQSYGIGFVFGKTRSELEGLKSYVRYGDYGEGTVFTNNRNVALNAGDSYYYRYYVILGSLSQIQNYGNKLADKVELGKIETPESSARLLPICTNPTRALQRNCPPSQSPLFYTYRDFVRGSLPLFLMQNTTTNNYYISSNPYYLDADPINAKARYIDLLGWVMPNDKIDTSLGERKALTALTSRSLFPATEAADKSLLVRTPPSNTSPLPSASPTSLVGDLNADQRVNALDYTLFLSGWKTKYTIFDYNNIIANYE